MPLQGGTRGGLCVCKNNVSNMKTNWITFAAIALVVAWAFWWTQVRPVNVRKECAKEAGSLFVPEILYQRCLHKNGL